MATEITCIIRDGSDPDRRIDSVGGSDWTKPENVVIEEIDNRTESYFVDVNGNHVEVEVAEREGVKYLRTDADQTTENNLLSLPDC